MQTNIRARYLALLSEAFAEPATPKVPEPPRLPEGEAVEGRLDAADSARLLAGYQGLPDTALKSLRFVRGSKDGQASAYAWDEDSGMVYILD